MEPERMWVIYSTPDLFIPLLLIGSDALNLCLQQAFSFLDENDQTLVFWAFFLATWAIYVIIDNNVDMWRLTHVREGIFYYTNYRSLPAVVPFLFLQLAIVQSINCIANDDAKEEAVIAVIAMGIVGFVTMLAYFTC